MSGPEAIVKPTLTETVDRFQVELKVIQAIQRLDDISPVAQQAYINRIGCGLPTAAEVERARKDLRR